MLKNFNIKLKILLPFAIVIILLMSTSVSSIFYLQSINENENLVEHAKETEQVFNSYLHIENQILTTHLDYIMSDSIIIDLFQNKNKEQLYKYCLPIFEQIKLKNNITHFYFIDTTDLCFLRVHNKNRFNDKIDRFTYIQSKKMNKTISGIELGIYGTFALRCVNPIIINNKTVGFIELGLEITEVTTFMKNMMNTDFVFVIDKNNVNKKNWEIGQKMLDKSNNWNDYSDFVITERTINGKFDLEKIYNSNEQLENFLLFSNNNFYKATSVPLSDVANKQIGKIIILLDHTQQKKAINILLIIIVVICIFVGLTIFLIFYKYTSTIEKHIYFNFEKLKKSENKLQAQNNEYASLNEEYKLQNDELFLSKEKAIESENKLKDIILSSNDWIWEIDNNGRYTHVHGKIKSILGYEADELIGKSIFEIMTKKEVKRIKDIYLELITKKLPVVDLENWNIHKNGNLVCNLVNGVPIFDKKGSMLGYRGVNKDISYLKKIINKLQKHNEEYSALNEEYRILNEELIIAKEKAEESSELKTEFINNMSHEIRTPLNAILGFSQLLKNPDLNKVKVKQFTDIIQVSGKQLLKIIENIIEISKLGTKQINVYEAKVCINYLLLDLYEIFNSNLENNKITFNLKTKLSDIQSTIMTDNKKLNTILNNLLENAFKFTKTGYIELGYNLIEIDNKKYLQIYIKDTGVGINESHHKSIFERFVQEEKGLSRKAGGLGLGLSIARENVELIDGQITLESVKGKGSTFYITIPYKTTDNNQKQNDAKN